MSARSDWGSFFICGYPQYYSQHGCWPLKSNNHYCVSLVFRCQVSVFSSQATMLPDTYSLTPETWNHDIVSVLISCIQINCYLNELHNQIIINPTKDSAFHSIQCCSVYKNRCKILWFWTDKILDGSGKTKIDIWGKGEFARFRC